MTRTFLGLFLLVALALGGSLTGCSRSSSNTATDGGTGDGGCFTNPMTSDQIINACTTAQRIDKQVSLPLLLKDGGLPPLP